MARLIYSRRALSDLEHLTDSLLEKDPAAARQTIELIFEAVKILENHPLVGRPAEHGLRERVISRGQTGYLALYNHEEAQDVVLILTIRHQRKAGHTME